MCLKNKKRLFLICKIAGEMIGLWDVFKGVDGDISPIIEFECTSNSPVTHQIPSYLLSLSPDPMQKKKKKRVRLISEK